MPTIRYEIRSEYGLADPELLRAADKDDPEAVLEGVAMSGLVGVLRQLGDLAEFATEIFHELHEEVVSTAARGHGLKLRVQQLEAEFPPVEKAFFSHPTHSSFTYNDGTDWHANIRMDQNLITQGDMPRFILDSYEECRGPPRLFMLDKFDIAGAGACLKRYSDPSFFKTEITSHGLTELDIRREKKTRKVKKKNSRGKIGQTLESLLSPNAESSSTLLVPSEVSGKPVKRLVRLKSRHLDRSKEIKLMEHLLELHSDVQKVVLDSSRTHSNGKEELRISNETTSEIHDAVNQKSFSHPLPNNENITSIDEDKRLPQTYTLEHQKIEDDLPEVPNEASEVEGADDNNHLAVQNEIIVNSTNNSRENTNDHALGEAERLTFPKDKNTASPDEVIKLTPTYESDYQMIEDEIPEISLETACRVKEVENNMHSGHNKIMADSITESGDSINDNKLDDAGSITFPRDESADEVIRSTPIYELDYAIADQSIQQQEVNQVTSDSKNMSGDAESDYQLSDAEKTTLLRDGYITTPMDESITLMPMYTTKYQKIENALRKEPHKEDTVNSIHLAENKELMTDSETMLSQETNKTLHDGELKLKSTGDVDKSEGIGSDIGNFMRVLNYMESEAEVKSERENNAFKSVDAMCLDTDEVPDAPQVQNPDLLSAEKTIGFHLNDILDDGTSCLQTSNSLCTMSETQAIHEVLTTSNLDRDFEMHLGKTQDNMTEQLEVIEAVSSSSSETCDIGICEGPGLRSDHMEVSYGSSVAQSTSELNIHCKEYHNDLQTHNATETGVSASYDSLSERTAVAENFDGLPQKNGDLPGELHPIAHMDGQVSDDKSGTDGLSICFLPTTNDNSIYVISHTEDSLVAASGIREIQELDDKHEEACLGEITLSSPDNVSTIAVHPHMLAAETPNNLPINCSSEEMFPNGAEKTDLSNNILCSSLGNEVHHGCENFYSGNHSLGITTHDMAVVSDQNGHLQDMTNQHNEFHVGYTPDSLYPLTLQAEESEELHVEDKKGCSFEVPDLNFSLTAATNESILASRAANIVSSVKIDDIDEILNSQIKLSDAQPTEWDHVSNPEEHQAIEVSSREELQVEDKKGCSFEIPDLNFSLTATNESILASRSANTVSSVKIDDIDEILNSQIKLSDAQPTEWDQVSNPEEHQAIEVNSREEKGAFIDHYQPHLHPQGFEVIESLVINLKPADECMQYSSEERKQIKENAHSDECSPGNVAAKDNVANHDLSSFSSTEVSCSQGLLYDNSNLNTAISYQYDETQVHETCASLDSQSILEKTFQSLEPALDCAAPDPRLQLLEEQPSDKNVSLVHEISKVQLESQSIVDDSEHSLERKQGNIQRSPEQRHHGIANEEMSASTNFFTQSATLPEEDTKLQVSTEENLASLRKLDEHFNLDTLTVSSESQSSVDDPEHSLEMNQGNIQRSPEDSHHGSANEEISVSTNLFSHSAILPEEEDTKLQTPREENLSSLRKLDEHFEIDTLTISSESQSSVNVSDHSFDRKQGSIQRFPEQNHHGSANDETSVSTNFFSHSATLPEEGDTKLQASREEHLTSLRKLDDHFELDALTVNSDVVTIPVEEADGLEAISGEHSISHTLEDNITTSSQLDEYIEVDTNTNPTAINDNPLLEESEANVIIFDNRNEHNDFNISSPNIDMQRQIESGIFTSSGFVSVLSANIMESDITERHPLQISGFDMANNESSLQVSYTDVLYQSSCSASQDIKEAPPLPPLPPLEWRTVKLRDDNLSSFGNSFQNLTAKTSAPLPVQFNPMHVSLSEDVKMVLSPHTLANMSTESSLDPNGKWEMSQLSQCPPILHDERDESCHQVFGERFMDLSQTSSVTSLQYEKSSYGPDESKEPKLQPSFAPFESEDKTSQHLSDVELEIFDDLQNINLNLAKHQNSSLVGSAINYDEFHDGNGTLSSDNDHFSSLEPSGTTILEISRHGYAALPEENQSPYGLWWRSEDTIPNVRPCSVRNRPRDPLIEAVAAHDRSTLRKVSDLVRPSDVHKADERNSMLEQIRNKAFNLRPAVVAKQNIKGPSTNLKVAAIIEKANAIRQACAGSDEDDDADSWSDS